MVFEGLLEAIGSEAACRPFDQPVEDVLAGHVPARFKKDRPLRYAGSLSSLGRRFDPEPDLP
jgi:hypothetical protein